MDLSKSPSSANFSILTNKIKLPESWTSTTPTRPQRKHYKYVIHDFIQQCQELYLQKCATSFEDLMRHDLDAWESLETELGYTGREKDFLNAVRDFDMLQSASGVDYGDLLDRITILELEGIADDHLKLTHLQRNLLCHFVSWIRTYFPHVVTMQDLSSECLRLTSLEQIGTS